MAWNGVDPRKTSCNPPSCDLEIGYQLILTSQIWRTRFTHPGGFLCGNPTVDSQNPGSWGHGCPVWLFWWQNGDSTDLPGLIICQGNPSISNLKAHVHAPGHSLHEHPRVGSWEAVEILEELRKFGASCGLARRSRVDIFLEGSFFGGFAGKIEGDSTGLAACRRRPARPGWCPGVSLVIFSRNLTTSCWARSSFQGPE